MGLRLAKDMAITESPVAWLQEVCRMSGVRSLWMPCRWGRSASKPSQARSHSTSEQSMLESVGDRARQTESACSQVTLVMKAPVESRCS
jgi:hypothetical protein